jgi:lipopolysaccharide transport system permease protein
MKQMAMQWLLRWPTSLWSNRELVWQLTKREIQGRYRGSMLGWGWSLVTPLMMLGVYTFVFAQVFQARWPESAGQGPFAFALNLFAGLIVFGIFAETSNQAPSLIVNNQNLVTKVIFPLEVLSAVSVASALFHALTSLGILVLFQVFSGGIHAVPATLLWLPLIWAPLIMGSLAISWILSSLGVYLRDLGQVTGVAVNLLMFLSAVFYPVTALPQQIRPILEINPLITIIQQTRRAAIEGQSPSTHYLIIGFIGGYLACCLAARGFQKASRGFADVL